MTNRNIRCWYCNWLNKEVLIPFICENCNEENKEYKEENLNEDWTKELKNIKGIGKETINDIKKIFISMDELKTALIIDVVPLRNDIVEKLKSYLLKGGNSNGI